MKISNGSGDKKALLSNFFSLSVLQGMNMLLPLVTLPYLVRVLGVEKFGLVNFAVSIVMYFNILVSFGFELSATREISIHRADSKKVSEIFSSVMFIKLCLLFLSFITLSILILTIEIFQTNALLYYATFGLVVGNCIFPTWLFQGMEKMKYMTYVNVFSKVLFTILIFVVIKKSSDYIYVPILNALGVILGSSYAFWLAFKLFSLKWVKPKKAAILKELVDSFQFFLSRMANNGSRYFVTTLFGLHFGNLIVGYYTMVEKLFFAFMSLGSVVSQTIYPYMARTRNLVFLKKILVALTGISLLLVIPIIYFNQELLQIIYDEQSRMLSLIFTIVFSGAVFAIMSMILGYPLLAAFGYIKYANNSLIYAALIYILYTTLAVYVSKDVYIVVFAIPVYMLTGLVFRVYYVFKTKLMTLKQE
ncbi:oligosaccharide flippase family protein [Aestuariivivens sediminicola]|uniref:oligosaccharide flippase family protein n=1 Tax=Aestuariivivens sediminicola TaxID=2913560 RepID=UPI001F580EE8|nr:oligosaccharide flippase family protein [Aestuariivivens sediminicola]